MQVNQLHGMRRDRQVERVRDMRDLHPFGNAANPADIRLHDVRAARRDKFAEAVLGVLVLASCHRNVDRVADFRKPLHIVRNQRFFKPADLILFELTRHVNRLLGVVSVIGVDVYGDIVTKRPPNRRESLNVLSLGLPEVLANLHLHARDALFGVAHHLRYQFLLAEVRPAAAAVYRHGFAVWSQQLEQRHAERLRLQVPQADVDGGYGAERHAFASVPAHMPEHLVPELLDVERVLAKQQIAQSQHNLPHARRRLPDAQSLYAFVRANVYEKLPTTACARRWRGNGGILNRISVRVIELRGSNVNNLHLRQCSSVQGNTNNTTEYITIDRRLSARLLCRPVARQTRRLPVGIPVYRTMPHLTIRAP